MRNRPVELIELDTTAACGLDGALPEQLADIMPTLATARRELLQVLPPTELLDEYRQTGGRGNPRSRLGQILATARRLADEVDRVVVVAGRDAGLAARAVLDSCAHPYHNELSRAERGGYPRVYLAPDRADNDALHALLDLLMPPRAGGELEHRWGLITVDDGALETAVVSRVLAQSLRRNINGLPDRVESLHVSIPASHVSASGDLLSAGVLLPAAMAGLDVVGLLSGAAAIHDRFAHDPADACHALRLAGLCHLAGPAADACQMVVWATALETAAAWYRRLREEAFAASQSELPADLHTRPLAGKIMRTPLVLHVTAQRVRRDRLMLDTVVNQRPIENDQLAAVAGNKLPEITQTMLAAAAAANRAADQPAVQLRLPQMDERSVGQLLQMLKLATAVEVRLATMRAPLRRCRQRAETGQPDTDSTHDLL